ncbi:MAG: DUF4118 domain-containing protein [Acidobacteriaceae bacterium]|nr:DUF4118 domain-containing protein [Acidobacteriaceae bacterium]
MKRSKHFFQISFRISGVLSAIAVLTAIDFRLLHVNSPTAALSYLLLILGLAAKAGLTESITASVVSMLAYNFFFLPPVGTLTIADPQNWIALVVFLVTAITASHLSSSARRKAREAAERERELQRMYDFSRALMLGNPADTLANQITQKISELFLVEEVAFYDRQSEKVCSITSSNSRLEEAALREVARTGLPRRNDDTGVLIVPVRLGGPCLGSLGIAGNSSVSEIALQAIAQLVAIAIERARAQELADRADATRQNEQLKSILLDAFAHEFKTPLTSIKAAATTVLSRKALDAAERDMLTVVDEEADHLNGLVTEAIELARIATNPVRLQRELCSVDKLIYSAIAQLRKLCDGRVLDLKIEQNLPPIEVDRRLTELALRQLLDNAVKYSPVSSQIEITAEKQSDGIIIHIFNVGAGIPRTEQNLVFEKFYRGREVRTRIPGTGMGLPIAREIIEAHGGRLWLTSELNKGAQFSFTVPTLMFRELPVTRPQQTT